MQRLSIIGRRCIGLGWSKTAKNEPKISINQRELSVTRTCIERPLAYETEHKTFRTMSKKKRRKPRKPGKALAYVVIGTAPRVLRLRNGTRLKQAIQGVDLYLSEGGRVYSLTERGLRLLRINYCKKNNYLKLTNSGHYQGQGYPYVKFRRKTYRVHTLMALAWRGSIGSGEETDHINGDIHNFRLENIRILSTKENDWTGGIIKRLRNIAKKQNNKVIHPYNIKPKDMLEIFERLKGKDLDVALPQEAEHYKVLVALRHATVLLHDPSINPDNMEPERRNWILSHYRVDESMKII